jgi:hypothetical protein
MLSWRLPPAWSTLVAGGRWRHRGPAPGYPHSRRSRPIRVWRRLGCAHADQAPCRSSRAGPARRSARLRPADRRRPADRGPQLALPDGRDRRGRREPWATGVLRGQDQARCRLRHPGGRRRRRQAGPAPPAGRRLPARHPAPALPRPLRRRDRDLAPPRPASSVMAASTTSASAEPTPEPPSCSSKTSTSASSTPPPASCCAS